MAERTKRTAFLSDRLRLAIDTALAEYPADLDEFLNLMKRAGYEVKKVRGGGISFRLTGQGQERFTRLRASTLGDGYDLQDVLSAIEGKEKTPRTFGAENQSGGGYSSKTGCR